MSFSVAPTAAAFDDAAESEKLLPNGTGSARCAANNGEDEEFPQPQQKRTVSETEESTDDNRNSMILSGKNDDSSSLLTGDLRIAAGEGAPPAAVAGKPKKKVSKFYEKQSALVEKFQADKEQIQEFARSRQRVSCSIDEDKEKESLVGACGQHAVEDQCSCTKTQDPPLVTMYNGSPKKRPKASTVSTPSSHEEMALARKRLAFVTLIVNITLMIIKAVAAYLSGSLSIISSLVDSTVDITSGLVIWLTARAIKKRDPYLYPRGRTRLEPLALIIVSVIMGVASVQMIVQSIESVVRDTVDPFVSIPTIVIMILTVVVKFILVLCCRRYKDDPSIGVLAQDHRNDCISNTVALICAYGAQMFWVYLDPIGAIMVSIYIATTWFFTGKEHLAMLSGKSAEPDFINRIINLCIVHDERIDYIDTVYVYHYGTRFLVEVHIVMDRDMRLETAHDISEALQINIESIEEVERAFVHTDFEVLHHPSDEHKVV